MANPDHSELTLIIDPAIDEIDDRTWRRDFLRAVDVKTSTDMWFSADQGLELELWEHTDLPVQSDMVSPVSDFVVRWRKCFLVGTIALIALAGVVWLVV